MKRLPYLAKRGNGDAGAGSWYDDYTWVPHVGPFMELQNWYDQFNFSVSVSDAANEAPRRFKVEMFGCATDGLKENEWGDQTWARVRTNYAVNAGNTDYGQRAKGGVSYGGAPFTFRKGLNFSAIDDGLSNTLMLAEVISVGEEMGNNWGGPVSDTMIACGGQAFTAWLAPNSRTPDGVWRVCAGDTSKGGSKAALNSMPDCTSTYVSEAYDQTLASRSKHMVGVHVAMCDGSVHFVSNFVDLNTWRALSTAKGREPVTINQ
jgi:hypothetical protein